MRGGKLLGNSEDVVAVVTMGSRQICSRANAEDVARSGSLEIASFTGEKQDPGKKELNISPAPCFLT